jgi:hypothetical protein
VHHAIIRVIQPLFEDRFISDSFACRPGKGTHRAMRRALFFARKYPFALKCDIQKYFPSIDHPVGLPIGNLSSQFFANVYLDALDPFVKHELRIKGYVRYVDDFLLFSESRCDLRSHPDKYRLTPTGWRYSNPLSVISPKSLPCVVDFSEIQRRTSERSATFPEDLEGIVQDRSQLGEDRTTANPAVHHIDSTPRSFAKRGWPSSSACRPLREVRTR